MQVPDLPFYLKQTAQLYDTMVFKLLSIRQLKTMIPERWETSEVSPAICPGTGRGNQGKHSGLSDWNRWSWDLEEAKVSSFHRWEYHTGESCTDREPKRPAEDTLQAFSWVLVSTREITQGPGKIHPKILEGTFIGAHAGLEIVFVSSIYNGENTQKVFASTVGQNFSQTIQLQSSLTKLKSKTQGTS